MEESLRDNFQANLPALLQQLKDSLAENDLDILKQEAQNPLSEEYHFIKVVAKILLTTFFIQDKQALVKLISEEAEGKQKQQLMTEIDLFPLEIDVFATALTRTFVMADEGDFV
jgi:hypothetical protein